MTATPEILLDEVMATIRRDAQCDVIFGHQVGLMFNGADIRQAVEAYGRACRIEELRKVPCDSGSMADCAELQRSIDKRCIRCDRIAELEREGG